ncbi:hypothetical protein ACS0TY_019243 [Phlomoides rotata]
MEEVSKLRCLGIWGNPNFEWAFRVSEGRSGGIISIWKKDMFHMSRSWSTRGVLVVNGVFTGDGGRGVLMNVYTPCSSSEKNELWEIIMLTVSQNLDAKVCVVGDFNTIRRPEEREGRREMVENRDIQRFEEFIQQSNLHELMLVGRSYMWYRPDGSCKSKIDRMLVNAEWLKLKEKLKLLKKDLREWNKVVFGDIDFNIDTKKNEIEVLDRIDDVMGLEEEEIMQRNKNTVELIRFGQWKEKLLAQNAKARWLRDEDVNSSYFHGLSSQQEECIGGMGNWTETGWEWDLKWRRGLHSKFKLGNDEEDIWRWRHTRDRLFSTASAYQKLGKAKFTEPEEQKQQTAFHMLWNSYAPRRFQAIVWKLQHNRLPTKERLRRMGIITDSGDIKCALCGEEDKTSIHLAVTCRIVESIWAMIYLWLDT